MAVVYTITPIDQLTVDINTDVYNRAELVVTLDAENGTLTVVEAGEGGDLIVATTGYEEIANADDEAFEGYSQMAAYVNQHVVYNVVDITSGEINSVTIGSLLHLRQNLAIDYGNDAERLYVYDTDLALVLIDTSYSNIRGDGSFFSTYPEMVTWVKANVLLNAHIVAPVGGVACYLIDGKPYPKDRMFFAWNDKNETVEVRYSHYDYSDKPLQPTHFSQIVEYGNETAISSYSKLIEWFMLNTFTYNTEN